MKTTTTLMALVIGQTAASIDWKAHEKAPCGNPPPKSTSLCIPQGNCWVYNRSAHDGGYIECIYKEQLHRDMPGPKFRNHVICHRFRNPVAPGWACTKDAAQLRGLKGHSGTACLHVDRGQYSRDSGKWFAVNLYGAECNSYTDCGFCGFYQRCCASTTGTSGKTHEGKCRCGVSNWGSVCT